MKFVVAIAVFFSICVAVSSFASGENEKTMDIIVGISNRCKAKLETPDEVVEKMILGEFDNGHADEKGMCHIKCIMEEMGVLKNGNPEAYAVFKSFIHDDEGQETMEKCQLETGKDECEEGYKVYVCFKANSDKIFKSYKKS